MCEKNKSRRLKSIAIITARGGSKRIYKKNIKEFYGKPMISYAIEAARSSEIFDEVMVSTDDFEIVDISKKNGATIPFMRSKQTASDYATTSDVLIEVIDEYKKKNVFFDSFCCIYPCVPFLSPHTLRYAFDKLAFANAVVPVCKYPVPVEWAMKIENNFLIPCNLDAQQVRSQDIQSKFYDVGMFYFFQTDMFLKHKVLTIPKTYGYIIPESECQDIDTIEDWKLAEIKYALMQRSN